MPFLNFKRAILILICSLAVFMPGSFYAFGTEQINNFNVQIKIEPNAILHVTETIVYDFGTQRKHGLYRYLPIKYKARGGNYKLRLTNIKIINQNGQAYHFKKILSGNNLKLKIGQTDKTVTGLKTYVISYNLQRAINYFNDHDELYWNVTGNGWSVPIKHASAEIILPHTSDKITHHCYAGNPNSRHSCAEEVSLKQRVVFGQSNLGPGQGLTIVVGWPKGWVNEPTWWQKMLATIYDNWILGLPLLSLIFMFSLWWRRGRDARGRSTIIAEYDAPDNLTPAQVGTLIDERADDRDITAEIIYLAIQGYLKIKQLSKKTIFIKHNDYELIKLKAADQNLNSFQLKLLKSIFSAGQQSVKLSELKNNFHQDLVKIQKLVYSSLVAKKYFTKNPQKVRGVYKGFGLIFIILAFFLTGFWGNLGFISFILSGFIIMIFGWFMPAKTKKGTLAKQHILGLKEYLTVAEKDRLKFHNAPEKKPQHFEKLLPYAMVLKVEKEWARQFASIYQQPPSWYDSQSPVAFNALFFVSSLDNFHHVAASSLSAQASSAASSGSGFSSGGVGGGFGGGGGGSW